MNTAPGIENQRSPGVASQRHPSGVASQRHLSGVASQRHPARVEPQPTLPSTLRPRDDGRPIAPQEPSPFPRGTEVGRHEQLHVVPGRGGRIYRASVSVTFTEPIEELAHIIQPQFWSQCILQVKKVEFIDPAEPPHGNQWKAQIREFVSLLNPLAPDAVDLDCRLDVAYEHHPGIAATTTYRLQRNGSEHVDLNQGKLTIRALLPDVSVVTLQKELRLKPGSALVEQLFALDPRGLDRMLRFWLLDVPSRCGSPQHPPFSMP
ncbi:hypothetical protein [Chondromyces apiculatus]|uniref:Uncharacterized protein n=1 Tax=Chondromyces apiculatus DSM 436 TaxID=1192034 RepID=A0A017THF7_9BACT|nr:hypothetical protein [Chondromyces apiculatus]EYF08708.1 Hypothetical protein CAP_2569 [Chondromyces apiculatus DSM 436]